MAVTRHLGDRVGVNHPKAPGVWIICSQGPKNSVLERESGGGRRLRVATSMLTDPPVEGGNGAVVTTVPYVPTVFYDPGEIVRIPAGKYAGVYVVIADKGQDKVNVAKLGGDGGRYVRATRGALVKLEPAAALAEVAGPAAALAAMADPVEIEAPAKAEEGRNPYGKCSQGHQFFRGGCPACAADMMGGA